MTCTQPETWYMNDKLELYLKTKRKAKKGQPIEPIPDTPENVAKALFGIKLTGKNANVKKAPRAKER